MCHSLYGTNIFKNAIVPFGERPKITYLIGDDAEWLVYIFCSCDRPAAFIVAADRGPPYWVKNRHNGNTIEMVTSVLHDLLLIEQANLQEQGSTKLLPRIADALCKVKMHADPI